VASDPDTSLKVPQFRQARGSRIVETWGPTVRYCMETEVHVYALSVAAGVLLSAFPFLIVIMSLCRYGLQWQAGVRALELALFDIFPGDLGQFIRRNLVAAVESRGLFQITSMFLLLFTANAVFEPLEVALNRVWGAARNRSYVLNQLVSLGLTFVCGGLTLLSFVLTTASQEMLSDWIPAIVFKIAAVPMTILALVLMYWLLPNHKVPLLRIIPISIVVGLALEGLKYVNLITWPLWKEKLQREYGPFYISVTILVWSFLAAILILAAAEWSARRASARQPGSQPSSVLR
jgi:membrane protein